jgi:hypothetical protein
MIRTTLAAAAAAAVLLGVTAQAPAEAATHHARSDSLYENCISWAEFRDVGVTGTMSNTEAFFGVTGRVVHMGDHGTTLIKQYRWCGYGESAVMVQIAYYLNKRGQWIAQYATEFDYRDPMGHQPTGRML